MKYLGNKSRLIGFIESFLEEEKIDLKNKNILDGFLGTGSFSKFAIQKKPKSIVGYDTLKSISYYAEYNILGVTNKEFYFVLNLLKKSEINFFYKNFSRSGGRQYFSDANAKKIDGALNNPLFKKMNNRQRGLFVDMVDRVSNTSGTYGAFLKIWRSMAKKDILTYNKFIHKNEFKDIKIFNKEIEKDSGKYDFAYLDPPYNSRQYSSNYHVLERLFDMELPNPNSKTGVLGTEYKSDFSKKTLAKKSFNNLIEKINSKYILISYSNEGILSESDWKEILKDRLVKIKYLEYRRFKTNSITKKTDLKEMLILVKK